MAGDNGAESEFSRSKQQMRRQSLYGRCSPATVHIAALAGVRMLEKPGLQQLLSCFRMYREARKHQLACSLTEFLDPVKDRDGFLTEESEIPSATPPTRKRVFGKKAASSAPSEENNVDFAAVLLLPRLPWFSATACFGAC